MAGRKDNTDHLLTIMGTVNEVKDDLREVRSHQERTAIKINSMQTALETVQSDVEQIKDGPMYSVEKYLQKQVIRFGGLGGLVMLLLALTGWSL